MAVSLFNAVARRELMVLLRSGRALAMALAYLGVLAVLILALWPDAALFSLNAQASRSMVLILVVIQTLLVMLYTPAFTAPSIVSEKENNSFVLLFSTLLRPGEILWGKFVSVVSVLLLFVVWSFPFFACCFLLGAVSPRETMILYALSVVTALLTGTIGLVISARAESSHGALIRTYLWMVVLGGGPWIPGLVLDPNTTAGGYAHAARALSPLGASASVLAPGFDALIEDRLGWHSWSIYLWAAGGLALGLGLVLMVLFTGQGGRRDLPRKVVEDSREIIQRRLRFPFYLIDPQRRRRSLPGWMNPVFARELRSRAQQGGVWFLRGAYLCLAVSMGLMVLVLGRMGGHDPVSIIAIALVFQLGLIVLLAPALSAGAITQERESGNLDNLRLSRIGPLRLIHGKLLMSLVFVLFLLVGSAPLWIVIGYMELTPRIDILRCWGVIAATVALCITLGLVCSAWCRRSSTATAVAYGLMFLICVATLFPLLMPDRLGASIEYGVKAMNPFLACMGLLNPDPFTASNPLWKPHLAFSLSLTGLGLALSVGRVWALFRPEVQT